jgi:hypothetical protein
VGIAYTIRTEINFLPFLFHKSTACTRAPAYLSLAETLALISAGGVGHVGSVLALHGNEVGEGDIAHVDLSKGPETSWNSAELVELLEYK